MDFCYDSSKEGNMLINFDKDIIDCVAHAFSYLAEEEMHVLIIIIIPRMLLTDKNYRTRKRKFLIVTLKRAF